MTKLWQKTGCSLERSKAPGYGRGVAVNRASRERVYMQMATAGANLGLAPRAHQAVFLLPAATAFHDFVTKCWDAGADADAVAG